MIILLNILLGANMIMVTGIKLKTLRNLKYKFL